MTLLISFLLGVFTTIFIYSIIVTLMTIESMNRHNLPIAYKLWLDNFKDVFSIKLILFGIIAYTCIFYVQICNIKHYNNGNTETKPIVCKCEACEKNTKKVNAVIKYLELDDEDLEELFEQVKAK